MGLSFGLILIAVVVFGAYVRLAQSDAARWNIDPATAYTWADQTWNNVMPLTGGAVLRIPASDGLLARLDTIAMATPHTTRFAGSVAEGRITWVTRSALWGFPDYTTAQIKYDGLYLYARLRFGKSDLGVNAARLKEWQSML